GGVIATTWQAHRAEQEKLANRRSMYAAHMNLAYQAWGDANIARALELLEFQRPRPGQEDLRGFEWYYLWRLCHSDPSVTLSYPDRLRSVAFSPDGRTLASGSADNTIKLWDVTTRQELATLDGHTGLVYAVAFSPDGHTLASGGADYAIKLWDVTT